MTPVPANIFADVTAIMGAVTAGATGLLNILMQPPMSYAIVLGLLGWGFSKVRGFIPKGKGK